MYTSAWNNDPCLQFRISRENAFLGTGPSVARLVDLLHRFAFVRTLTMFAERFYYTFPGSRTLFLTTVPIRL